MNSDDWSMTLVGGPLLFILSTLNSSPLSHDIHFHSDAIKLAGNLFIGTSFHNLKGQGGACSDQSNSWCVLSDKYLALLGDKLLIHVLRMLNIFQHIIEDISPSSGQSKVLPSLPTPPTLSPIKRKSKAGKESETSQGRNVPTITEKAPVKEPIREGLGYFANIQHYLQLYSILKSSYLSFKISSELINDKFLQSLRSVLVVLSQMLELTTLNEVSRCTEELLSYLASIFALESSMALVCIKQLLRSIFGTNMSSEETVLNRQQMYSMRPTSQLIDSLKLYDVCFRLPMSFLCDKNGSHLTDVSSFGRKSSERTALMAKIFSKTDKSSVGAYIKLFEPLVIRALKQYTLTSLPDVQLHVLNLLTTLVQLRVNYCLLDSDQIFIGFVLKQIEMIETGQSRATDGLLPEIFNFLIQLSFEKYHNRSIITMSKVIQLCDGIIASELEPSLYAVPCLKHVVSALFNSEVRQSDPKELDIQREVVVSMLLKLLRFCEVLEMLCLVLRHAHAESEERLNKLSRQISDHLFPVLMKHEILIKNTDDLGCVKRLFESLSPCVFRPVDILVSLLFTVPVQEMQELKLSRWMVQVICCLKILLDLNERDAVLLKISQMREAPSLFSFPASQLFLKSSSSSSSSLQNSSGGDYDDEFKGDSGELILANFVLHVVEMLLSSIKGLDENENKLFLCQEMFQMLVLLEKMLYTYPEVLTSMRQLMIKSSSSSSSSEQRWLLLTNDFLKLLNVHPLILLRWCSVIIIIITTSDDYIQWWSRTFTTRLEKASVNVQLIREAGFLLICQQVVEKRNDWNSTTTISWLIEHHFEDVVKFHNEGVVKELMSNIHADGTLSRIFCQTVRSFCDGHQMHSASVSFTRCVLKCLETCHPTQVGENLKLVVNNFLSTCFLPINKSADRMACSCAQLLLATQVDECKQLITLNEVKELYEYLSTLNLKKSHLSSLFLKLIEHLKDDDDDAISSQLQNKSDECKETYAHVLSFGKEEYLRMLTTTCLDNYTDCPSVLLSLDYSSILSIFMSENCSPLLLSSCMKMVSSEIRSGHDLFPNHHHVTMTTPMQLFKAASFALQRNINKVVNHLPAPYRFFDGLTKPAEESHDTKMIELFLDQKIIKSSLQLSRALQVYVDFLQSLDANKKKILVDIPESNVKDICRFCIFYLELVHWHTRHGDGGIVSSLDILPALTCTSLCLSIHPFHEHLSSPDNFLYICSAVHLVHSLQSTFIPHPDGLLSGAIHRDKDCSQQTMFGGADDLSLTTRTCDLMCELIVGLTPSSQCLPLYLRTPFRKAIIALARMPLVNSYARTPSLVWTLGWSPTPTGGNKTKLPPIPLEFLQDKDVLSDYIFRASAIGWTNRHQFEETWMSLLAVLNPVSHDESQSTHEECLEKTHCQILSMRAITSLLLSCTLTPDPGNPSLSNFKHKPRNSRLLNFFTTGHGQKLLRVKMKLESDLWNLLTDEQMETNEGMIPLVHNLEREIADMSFSPAQFSTAHIISTLEDYKTLDESSPNIVQSVETTIILPDDQLQLENESETSNSSDPEITMKPSDHKCPPLLPSSKDIDIHSCLQFLLELYGSFLSSSSSSPPSSPTPKIPLNLLNETVRSILLLSDVFTDRSQYEWVLMMMLELSRNHPIEDELLACYVVLATCKAVAVIGVDAVSSEKIIKLMDMNLKSTHLPTKIFTLYGGLYILESNRAIDLSLSIVNIFVDYLLRSLSGFTPSTIHSQQHALVMWSLSFYILEHYHDQVKESDFNSKIFQICTSMISTYQESTPLPIFSCIITGLQRLAISQTLDLECLIKLATDRFCQQNTQRSLMSFNLIVTCMYVDFLRPKDEENAVVEENNKDFMSDGDATMKTMEKITVIFDRIRKGLPYESSIIMNVLPMMLIHFFQGHEVINKIIVEFLSNQQPQTQLFARLLFQVFDHLLQSGQSQLVMNWVILSLSNFTQKNPIGMAIWGLTCLFICSSNNHWLRSIYPIVIKRVGLMEELDAYLFKTSAIDFYKNLVVNNNDSHAESFLVVFQAVAPLHPDAPYKQLLDDIKTLEF